MPLTLRRAEIFAKLNSPDTEDFDVLDGPSLIGRIYRKSPELLLALEYLDHRRSKTDFRLLPHTRFGCSHAG